MVGIGPEGIESSLARVSIVNYYGHVLLDTFVQQREPVTDYRTQWSGVRASDLSLSNRPDADGNGGSRPFPEVQKVVNEFMEGKTLIGHAVFNDCKVLFLSHAWMNTRDTQVLARKCGLVKGKYVSLRDLVLQELGLRIQSGEHSSVSSASFCIQGLVLMLCSLLR